MGCCGCFGFLRKSQRSLLSFNGTVNQFSQDYLVPQSMEDAYSYNGDSDGSSWQRGRSSQEILLARSRNGLICREVPVKETRRVTISEVNNTDHYLFLQGGKNTTCVFYIFLFSFFLLVFARVRPMGQYSFRLIFIWLAQIWQTYWYLWIFRFAARKFLTCSDEICFRNNFLHHYLLY